ncbi:MAG TPA: hypothetical protein VFS11_00995 [Gemmatimonadales bacterium]|nr:hypothetical protein [Gemmatimonadales bacterium]
MFRRCAGMLPLALAVSTAACASRLGPEVFGATIAPADPPPQYAEWYAELRACVGNAADRPFDAIHWYRSEPGATLIDPRTGEVLAGFWTARGSAIIVGDAYAEDPAVVKHELLHYLRAAGDHRDSEFRSANECGVAPVPVTAAVSAAAVRPAPSPSPIP